MLTRNLPLRGAEAKVRLGVKVTKAFIPLDPEVGREAEVDWGTALPIIGGKPTTVKSFGMRSRYSAKHFMRGYPCERQQAFLDAHLHAFIFFGGFSPTQTNGLVKRFFRTLKE